MRARLSAHALHRFRNHANCKYQDTSIHSIASMQNKHSRSDFCGLVKIWRINYQVVQYSRSPRDHIAAKITKLSICISHSRVDCASRSVERDGKMIIIIPLSEAHPLKREKGEKFAKYISRLTRSKGRYQ